VSSREEILTRVRACQPAPQPLPPVPLFDNGRSASFETFAANLRRMGGKVATAAADATLDVLVRSLFPAAAVIASATPEVNGDRPLQGIVSPAALADVDVGVVRATFGVAETGSVWLSETEFVVNALGFLAQHLVVLLDPQAIVTNLHHAYQYPGFFTARYAVLMTGPSATADIEGVLIHGAQGIRSLTVIPRTAREG